MVEVSDLLNSVHATFNHVLRTTDSEADILSKQGILKNELVLGTRFYLFMRLSYLLFCYGQLILPILHLGALGRCYSPSCLNLAPLFVLLFYTMQFSFPLKICFNSKKKKKKLCV